MEVSKKKLDFAMARAKINMVALAKKAKVSHATVSRVRQGKSCRPEILGKIAEALGVDVSELLADEDV